MNKPPSNLPTDRGTVRPRPALFLALGRAEPPTEIEVGDKLYQRIRIFKHDSWAATALYEHESERIVVKFNRQQSILGIPMQWLGRALAGRETKMLERLAEVSNVPAACASIKVNGRVVPTASGHDYVAGRSLLPTDEVDDEFFPQLSVLLSQLHERGIAYVDLHKRDNILVDEQGAPHLIDFQISMHLPQRWPFSSLLGMLQSCDRYHVAKHKYYFRPDLCDESTRRLVKNRPAWIKAHRLIAVPFRHFRRWLLVRIGVRKAGGMATSEHSPQQA